MDARAAKFAHSKRGEAAQAPESAHAQRIAPGQDREEHREGPQREGEFSKKLARKEGLCKTVQGK